MTREDAVIRIVAGLCAGYTHGRPSPEALAVEAYEIAEACKRVSDGLDVTQRTVNGEPVKQ